MYSRFQPGIEPDAPTRGDRTLYEPVSTATFGVCAPVTAISQQGLTTPIGRLSFWISSIRNTAVLEWALIAILFTLITVLVGIRGIERLSDRDVTVVPLRLRPPARKPQDAERSSERETDGDRTGDRRAYERIIPAETPPELLSDEGRVVQLLVKNGGEIRQHRITDETGWSKSKVSRLCSSMCDDGTVEKITVGRENVISLPEERPDETARSPAADEPAS
ncbi:helix-turn-helix transcriptional regulator [Natrialbaceae archaeon A-arb3/5]